MSRTCSSCRSYCAADNECLDGVGFTRISDLRPVAIDPSRHRCDSHRTAEEDAKKDAAVVLFFKRLGIHRARQQDW